MVEKKADKCVTHNLEIQKFTQSNKDGTIESVDACDICAKILKVAGYDLNKVPAVAGQAPGVSGQEEEERGAFNLPKKVLDDAKKAHKKAFGDEIPWWLKK